MGLITSAYCNSAKIEHYYGAHCIAATVTPTGNTTSGAFTISSMSSNVGICVGMSVSGSGIPTGSVVASINSATQITISKAATATASSVTLTIAGDIYRVALFKAGVTGTYDATTTNYSDMTGNSDEVTGTGYTATGTAITNVSPVSSSGIAYVTFSNPSWTSATFSTDGCMIYNSSTRLGDTTGTGSGRALGVFSFGSTQTVTAATFTVLLPAATSSAAIFRIG